MTVLLTAILVSACLGALVGLIRQWGDQQGAEPGEFAGVRTHTLCIFIMAAGYAGIIFFGQTSTALYALMAVVGIGWAAVVSLPFAIMSDSVDKARMGTFMGIFNLSVVLPQFVTGLVVARFIGDAGDKSLTFVICAIALAISAVLWALLKEDKTEPGELAMGGSGH